MRYPAIVGALLSCTACTGQAEQPVVADGGRLLFVSGAAPPFGVLSSLGNLAKPFIFTVHVQSDSANLDGRLCVELDDECCLLRPQDPEKTRCFGKSRVGPTGSPVGVDYEVSFPVFAPCAQLGPLGRTAYVVPVLATGGFDDSDGILGVDGRGTVDKSHFWSVLCRQ